MKITVLYNQVIELSGGRPQDLLADVDSVKTAEEIKENLSALDFETDLLEVKEDNSEEILTHKTDLFFNQAFGLGSIPKSESDVTDILEQTKIPYTGSKSEAILFTTDKIGTKKLLIQNSLPTAKYQIFRSPNDHFQKKLHFPLILKPACEDCSIGIDINSVIYSEEELNIKLNELEKVYPPPFLVEEFIDGRELNVTVFGNGPDALALPISEILFDQSFNNRPKIISFAAKWQEKSDEYLGTTGAKCPADLPLEIENEVKRISVEAALLSGCSDYCRVDVRLSLKNKPSILEINANPGIGPLDGASRSAKAAGLTYPQFLSKIVEFALARAQ